MEVAATLAGAGWADCPPDVPGPLAQLARTVNDCTSDGGRPALAPLIPWVLATPSPAAHPDIAAAMCAAVTAGVLPVAAAGAAAAAAAAGDRLRTAAQRLAAAAWAAEPSGVLSRAIRRRELRRALTVSVRAAAAATGGAERDALLRGLLLAGLNVYRRAEGRQAIPDPDLTAGDCARAVPIAVRLVTPDVAESLQLEVRALLELWPSWLREPWEQRRAELAADLASPAGLPQSRPHPRLPAAAR